MRSLPGGRLEQPVVNCRKAFLSFALKPTRTLTNFSKAGESREYPSLGSVKRTTSSRVKAGQPSPQSIVRTSSGLKEPSLSIGKTVLKPERKASS